MCGRYSLAASPQLELGSRFGLRERLEVAPRYNICPGDDVLAVVERDAERQVRWLSWGLVPHWAKDPKIGARMINARAETASEKPAFRDSLLQRRCLLIADGFYEWSPKPEGGKQPWHITAADSEPFAFAGITASWRPEPGGPVHRSCAILTRPASPAIAHIHAREPVILGGPAAEAAWLDSALNPADIAELLAAHAQPLKARAVSKAVNDARYDGPACLDDAEPEPQGTLFAPN